MSNVEIQQLLVASTAHVTAGEREILDSQGTYGEYGWLLPVMSDLSVSNIDQPSAGLLGALKAARVYGCAYLLLDRDADPIDGVTTYDW